MYEKDPLLRVICPYRGKVFFTSLVSTIGPFRGVRLRLDFYVELPDGLATPVAFNRGQARRIQAELRELRFRDLYPEETERSISRLPRRRPRWEAEERLWLR